jgi:hypothetical protein
VIKSENSRLVLSAEWEITRKMIKLIVHGSRSVKALFIFLAFSCAGLMVFQCATFYGNLHYTTTEQKEFTSSFPVPFYLTIIPAFDGFSCEPGSVETITDSSQEEDYTMSECFRSKCSD